MLFQQLNILKDPMPLETDVFDVVHLRCTLLHVSLLNEVTSQPGMGTDTLDFVDIKLPNGQTVLSRLASLVAPHGYLLIDELTIRDLDVDKETSDMQLANVPGIKRCIVTWAGFMRSRGQDPSIGPKLKPWLDEMSEFETVEVDEVKLPLHPLPIGESYTLFLPSFLSFFFSGGKSCFQLMSVIDPRLRAVSETIFASLSQAFTGPTSEALEKYGYTDELKQAWLDEVGRRDLEWKYTVALHFVWARKAAGGGI